MSCNRRKSSENSKPNGWNRPLPNVILPQSLPQGHFSPFLRFPKNAKTRLISGFPSYSGGRIRTCDLRVMSPTSYLAAPPRGGLSILAMRRLGSLGLRAGPYERLRGGASGTEAGQRAL